MRISVTGTGYVGLIYAVGLADKGHDVVCVDIDEDKVRRINSGQSPIHEDGLDAVLTAHIGSALHATTDLVSAVMDSEVTIIAVGTPFDGQRIDLSYIEGVASEIGSVLADKDEYHVVMVKSTVVPGTTDDVVLPLLETASGKRAGQDFGVGMNPEFLREGVAVADFMNPDRIVLGGIDDKTHGVMQQMYAAFSDVDIVLTSNKTAELIKYTANSLLATMISFSNEIANLCTAVGDVDVVDVMRGVHLDKRLTPLKNGTREWPGFGGSCFPKDVKALIAHGDSLGQSMDLLKSVIRINDTQPLRVIDLLLNHFDALDGLRVAVLGLAFKPATDDMRESPAITIIEGLLERGADVSAFDPVARHESEKLFGTDVIHYGNSVAETIAGVDAILVLTRWDLFLELPELLKSSATQPLVVDARRMLNKDSTERYDGIGYPSVAGGK